MQTIEIGLNILLCCTIVVVMIKTKHYKKELETENLIAEKLKNVYAKYSISQEEYDAILSLRTTN